ncbi:hypothetical protein [Prosthecobacter sp.]|uniref:hypothetical protein n=1 Tax=Prosthecobacter sp. TaxID=1965333 RepID=UPI00378445CD
MGNPLAALAVTAERAAAELAGELTPAEVLTVQAWILESEEAAGDWLFEHRAEIDWVASSTPAKRRSRASLRHEPKRARLLYWAAVRLERGARCARVLASVPLPETASFDRSLAGTVLSLEDAAYSMQEALERPCWNEFGEWWA